MNDNLDDLLQELRATGPAPALDGLESRLWQEIHRRRDRQQQVWGGLQRNAAIAIVGLLIGLGTGLSHEIHRPSASSTQGNESISLLLTEIPAASLIE